MTTFAKDNCIIRNDVTYRINRLIGDDLQLENTITGEFSTHKVEQLLQEYCDGVLHTVPKKRHEQRQPNRSAADAQHQYMSRMSVAGRAETRRRIDYIVQLEDMHVFNGPQKALRKAILTISQLRNELRPPHITTVYRWQKKFRLAQKDIRALFARLEERGGKGNGRLESEVEAIIDEKIETVFLARKKGSAEDVHSAVFLAIQKVNTTRTEDEWLKTPGLRTIQRRIAKLYAFDIAVARYGMREAERRFAPSLGARRVSRILEIVEIDHSPVDLMVTNDQRIVIGRPTITLILDRYSRCVLGYHLSLAGHGTPAVFEALRHALLPKTYLTSRYGDLGLDWPCYGWMERLVMDNGREFHAEAVADALTTLGIVTEYAASREPNDKPFVERFLRTFNYSFIHRLPGTTLAKVHQRIGFKAEDDACLTLEELDRMVHAWIMGVYHLRPHAGLNGRAPIDVWQESAAAHPPQLKSNAEDVDIEFSEVASSRVQHYGIDLNTFRYTSTRLNTLFRTLPQRSRVDVKWPRHDVGYIYVWDPLEKEYIKVSNQDESFAGLTYEQAKAAKRKNVDDPVYRQTRAETAEIVREMSAESMNDAVLKTRRKGARFANKTTKHLHREVVPDPVARSEVDCQIGTIEDDVEGFEVDLATAEEGV